MLRGFSSCLAFAVLLACGDPEPSADASGDSGPPLTDVETSDPGAPPLPGFDECVVTTARHVSPTRNHFPPCSELSWPTHPPASGDHFDRWADYRTYTDPVPTGFLLHAMEHGAVVFNYDCPDGCDDVLAAFDAAIAAHGVDPACTGVDARFIVAPDPTLDVPIAITAWEHVYTATCLDEESLLEFVESHYGQAPEDLCARGFDGEERSWCE